MNSFRLRWAGAGLTIALLMVTAGSAQAGTLYWDGGTTDIVTDGDGASQGGAGTWNTTLLNWDQWFAPHVAWVNGNNDTAVFGGTAGTVTLGTGITVGGLTFDVAGYTITSDTLTFGAAGSVSNAVTATIGCTLAGGSDAAISKDGAGTLILSGANTYAGATAVNAGALQFNSAGAIGGSDRSVTVADGAAVSVGYAIDNAFLNRLAENSNAFNINMLVSSANDLDFSGATGATLPNVTLYGTAGVTYGGSLTPGGNTFRLGNLNATAGFGNALLFTVSSALTGDGNSLVVGGSQQVVISASSTYKGSTTVNTGAALRFDGVIDDMGGGAGVRDILVADGASIVRGAGLVNNAFLNRLVETTNAFTIYMGNAGCGNSLDFSNGGAGAYLPNVSIAFYDSVGTRRFLFTGTITPANDTYRLGGQRAANYLNFPNANALTGANGLVVPGGKVRLLAANDFSGATLVNGVNAGTLYLCDNLALQNSAIDTSGAGLIDVSGDRTALTPATATPVTTPTFGGLQGSKDIVSVFNATYSIVTALTLNPGADVTNSYSGIIADGAPGMMLIKTGAGTQILAGANTYTGATTINDGTLRLGADNTFGADNNVVLAGGALDMGSYSNQLGTLEVTGSGSIVLGSGSLSFLDSSLLNWPGSLTLEGILGPHTVRFGNSGAALTGAQLQKIRVDGQPVHLDADGYVVRGRGEGGILVIR